MYYTYSDLNRDMEYEMAIEARLNTKQRRELPDDAFGLPEDRKYPLIVKDEDGNYEWEHLRKAIAYFHVCKDEEKRKILAENIARVIREYNVDIKIAPRSPIRRYTVID